MKLTFSKLLLLFLFAQILFQPCLIAQNTKEWNEKPEILHSSEIGDGQVPVILSGEKNICSSGGFFTDPAGRTMFLRGINLGGSSKVPYSPNLASHVKDGFFNGRELSFTGRPFPLEDADEHFSRLKAWGFHFLRFLVTWEAIEHEGPGIYDYEYLAYLRELIIKAGDYGLNVIIDPHEDVWSRFSGGDGAPLWTLEAAGFDVTNFAETGAALVHNTYGDPFPQMVWFTNNYKLASATMFTLFFGGNDFAPKTMVGDQPIQDYLQEHYIASMMMLAEELRDLPNVVGFELMNEPSAGYIGVEDLTQPFHTELIGDAPTPWQSILAGEGIPQTIDRFRVGAVGLKSDGTRILNPDGKSAWLKNEPGIWIKNGIGEILADGSVELSDPGYFAKVHGTKVDFNRMYYEPFARRYAKELHKIDPDWMIIVDNCLFPYPNELPGLKDYPEAAWVNGSHWYDDVTLVKKRYIPFLGFYEGRLLFGSKKVLKGYEKTLAAMIRQTDLHYGSAPSLLGEFGIPFDMNKGKAFKTGNFRVQAKALDRSFRVAEKNLLNYTLWNYTSDNTNERGDNWNGEDLSVFSLSQQENPLDINSGGRALDAAIRPYPVKIAGTLTEYQYDYKKKVLTIAFTTDSISALPTEIFLPEYIYGNDFFIEAGSVRFSFDRQEHILLCYPEKEGEQRILIRK